jgi:Tat protein translocase TatB subunit
VAQRVTGTLRRMFNIGGGELIVIALIALIVLGPSRLPNAARQVGKTMGDLRRISSGFQNELKTALDDADRPAPVRPAPASTSIVDAIDAVSAQATPNGDRAGDPAPTVAPKKGAAKKAAPKKTAAKRSTAKKAAPKKATPRKAAASKAAPKKASKAVSGSARRRSPG